MDLLPLSNDQVQERDGKFDEFWAAVDHVLLQDMTVPDDRRHGTAACISPAAVSLRHLRDLAIQHLRQSGTSDAPVPCEEYLRLQFLPRNPHAATAKTKTGRFHVKWLLQTRLIRKSHPDHYFGAALFKYFRAWASMFAEHTLCIFLDDKASIGIGPVGAPASSTRRQRVAMGAVLGASSLSSCDHDHIPMHITPSLIVKLRPPASATESFYGGIPGVGLKCAIFQASDPMRHITEAAARETVEDKLLPIRAIYTDGGVDHRTVFISVHLALIAYFMGGNLDILIAARTPPNLSVLNPAERVMSVLNIGLNGVSLARKELSPDKEALIAGLGSKKQWRDAQHKQDALGAQAVADYRAMAKETTEDCINLLTARLEGLEYKGEPVAVRPPATEDEIHAMRQHLHRLDNDVHWAAPLKKTELLKRPLVSKFYKEHVVETQYCLQIKKCCDAACPYHDAIRMPADEFCKALWLPMPTLAADRGESKFKLFEDAYVDEQPTDEDRPGAAGDGAPQADPTPKAPFTLVKGRLRGCVRCADCNRPRLYFSQRLLTTSQLHQMECAVGSYDYSCGGPLFPDDHGLEQIVFVTPKLSCATPISAVYYSSGMFPNVCYHCTSEDIVSENTDKFPMCLACKDEGRVATGGPSRKRARSGL